MIRFVKVFPEFEIVSALMRQLRWRPFLHIIFDRSTYYSFLEMDIEVDINRGSY